MVWVRGCQHLYDVASRAAFVVLWCLPRFTGLQTQPIVCVPDCGLFPCGHRDVSIGYVPTLDAEGAVGLTKFKPDGCVTRGGLVFLYLEIKPNYNEASAKHDLCVWPSRLRVTLHSLCSSSHLCPLVTGLLLLQCSAKLGAMCAGMFRVYWAAMQFVWRREQVAAEREGTDWRFHWTDDPYLANALPAVQVNGLSAVVYYAHLIPHATDNSFEASGALAVCHHRYC